MSKYTILHICGHNGEHQLFGKHTERLDTLVKRAMDLCPACYKKEKAEKVDQVSVEWPAITGSAAQIEWARAIRVKLIANMDAFFATAKLKPAFMDEARERFQKVRDYALTKTEGRWWIDNRYRSAYELINILWKEISEA